MRRRVRHRLPLSIVTDPRDADGTPGARAAPPREVARAVVLERLRSFKQARASELRISRLGIFGSVARDEADADSDIDVVFETDDPNLFRTARLRQELEAWLGRPVDIVRLRPRMSESLRERIVREARYV